MLTGSLLGEHDVLQQNEPTQHTGVSASPEVLSDRRKFDGCEVFRKAGYHLALLV